MKYDPIEQAKLIYEAQPTAYNASAYQVAMQLAALKAELEQDKKQLQDELKAAKAHLAYAERMAEQYKWHPIETAPMDNSNILVFYKSGDGGSWVGNGYYEQGLWNKGEYVGWVCEGEYNCQPTHWMPLPEAPEIPKEPVSD